MQFPAARVVLGEHFSDPLRSGALNVLKPLVLSQVQSPRLQSRSKFRNRYPVSTNVSIAKVTASLRFALIYLIAAKSKDLHEKKRKKSPTQATANVKVRLVLVLVKM